MRKLLICLFFSFSVLLNANIKTDLEKSLNLITQNKFEDAKKILHTLVEKKSESIQEKRFIDSAIYYLANIYHRENNIEKAKQYYRRLSENTETRTFSVIKANQYLLSIAMEEGDMKEAINQTEILNRRTSYQELPFLSNLIYLYEINNEETKLQKLNRTVINKLSEIEKGKLYNLLAMTYLENSKYDSAKRYFDLLLQTKNNDNRQLGYIGYANYELSQGNRTKSLEYLEKALSIKNDTPIYILEGIQKLYAANAEYEKAYETLIKIEKISNVDAGLIIDLIKYAHFLDKKEDVEMYLNKLENMGISSFDLGMKMASENLIEYAERYLVKAKREGNAMVHSALLNIYFGTQEIDKLKEILDIMLENREITEEKKESILKEFEHYQKYKNKGNE
ncbi:tetratricopeptide repeat protein [Streptobacillus canis]|uniref:tetratricopeptide repeat protein n=1 Tax=Streptobacillus canis TaxID=2678686 RepID=UPI0012E2A4EF|nr:tetratricopeptide repeat protein [Streptobacillus canis]